MLHQKGNVVTPLGEWRNVNGQYIDAIVQIASEGLFLYKGFQIPIGDGDQSGIVRYLPYAADSSNMPILQGT